MKIKISFYQSSNGRIPVKEYLKSLGSFQIAKIRNVFRLLKEFGSRNSYIFIKKIKGKKYNGLYEIKVRYSRVLYFLDINNEYILLHGYTKKTNKSPERELDIALRRMKQYKIYQIKY